MIFTNKNLFLVITTVLVLARQSAADEQAVQDMIDEFDIYVKRNAEYSVRHKGALDAIDGVNEEADAAEENVSEENEIKAIKEVREALIAFIKSIAVSSDLTYEANQEALSNRDSQEAEIKVKASISDTKQGVKVGVLLAYQKVAAASVLAGDYTKQPVKESIKFMILAVQAANAGLDRVGSLASAGLRSGGAAKKQGIQASNEAIQAVGAVVYNILSKAVKNALGGIGKLITVDTEDESRLNETEEESPETLSTIDYINNIADATADQISEGQDIDAVRSVQEAIVAAIKDIAAAIQPVQEALEAAEAKEGAGIKSTKDAIGQEIKAAKKKIVSAAAKIVRSLGFVVEIIEKDLLDSLEEAFKLVEDVADIGSETLEAVKFLVFQGLENGDTATTSAIAAATDGVLTITYAANAILIAVANIAFNVLTS